MSAATASDPGPFASVEEAIEEIRQGRMVVVVDAADRENEGDLTIAAQFATPEAIAFMAKEGRGLVCLCLTGERCAELGLEQMVERNETRYGTAFTVSIEAREGISTGISAHDRARTIQVAIDPSRGREDLVQPGHVFPLQARPGGVLERAGQTEASVDLARLAGLNPAGVICEILKEDGTMARLPDLVAFCRDHGLKLVTVADLIEYRRRADRVVVREATARMPTAFGEFTAVGFRELLTGKHHVALVKGDLAGAQNVLVRVHSECLVGDVFHSLRCDCGDELDAALRQLAAEPRGVLVYLSREGRGLDLLAALRAVDEGESGEGPATALDAAGAPDDRDRGIGSQILADLGLTTIRLLTNNPQPVAGVEAYGLRVTGHVPLALPGAGGDDRDRPTSERDKLGRTLHHQGLRFDAEDE